MVITGDIPPLKYNPNKRVILSEVEASTPLRFAQNDTMGGIIDYRNSSSNQSD
jgi:hypothetical protein